MMQIFKRFPNWRLLLYTGIANILPTCVLCKANLRNFYLVLSSSHRQTAPYDNIDPPPPLLSQVCIQQGDGSDQGGQHVDVLRHLQHEGHGLRGNDDGLID